VTSALELASARQLQSPRRSNDKRWLLPDCQQLGARLEGLSGPGAQAVRSAARRLVVAMELYEQHERRVAAEVLREEEGGE